MIRTLGLAAALAITALPVKASEIVELELVLAVDASSSVTSWEFDLQMQGLADAFRDPEVQGAIQAAGERGIAVSLVQWSGRDRQVLATDWMHIYSPSSSLEFADELAVTPRFISGGSTAIGNAIEFSVNLLTFNAYEGLRRVIDVSGDGRTNQGIQTSQMRDAAIVEGVTVNGLAILNEDPSVDHYFKTNVIGGSGAFLLSATDYQDFSRAIKQKLLREIAGPPIAQAPGSQPAVEQMPRTARAARPAASGTVWYRQDELAIPVSAE
ncbi:DUF1194 domain-containing protein [Algihabitans albus]|uniref:DUF1194 domain-containing protein n=1 Tax=Algihabitans albus TaxID=2164067 RepID=UPI0013C37824|nr:DUF1194 domain-containing protein [Algihabitans albus]